MHQIFCVNIKIDSRAQFKRVKEGDFGTIGGVSSSADIKYQYNNGILKAYGLKDKNTEYNEPMILFYIINCYATYISVLDNYK